VLIGPETKLSSPEDGEIKIPRGVVHSLRGFHDEETIFEEGTDPMVCIVFNFRGTKTYPFLSV